MKHHTRLFINLRAYNQNIRYLKRNVSHPCKICAVVKADAYGHGLAQLAPIALHAGADTLGIVDNWEAQAVRDLGLTCPILRLRPAILDEVHEALQWEVEEIVGNVDSAQQLSCLAQKTGREIPVHFKIDTGIGRMGFALDSIDDIKKASALPGLKIIGVMTHFPCADAEDLNITRKQSEQFHQFKSVVKVHLPADCIYHSANSAAALRFNQCHDDMVRLGIASYGLQPCADVQLDSAIEPVMSWKTRIVQIRNMPRGATIGYGMTYQLKHNTRIATLPVGYADGYLRAFSNQAEVIIRAERCPVVGRVSMNMTTVDVTHLPSVQVGDEVVLLGKQGDQVITAEQLARWASTINYEIACLIGKIAPREYISQ